MPPSAPGWKDMIHLAPLHLPGNLLGLDLCRQRFNVPQVACFDTAFHATLPDLAKRLPIPNELGLRRFGFHGLNYAYIAEMLAGILGDVAYKKVVVAHLGQRRQPVPAGKPEIGGHHDGLHPGGRHPDGNTQRRP